MATSSSVQFKVSFVVSELLCLYTMLQTLEKVSSQYKASYQEATAKYNSSKNRFPDKLPSKRVLYLANREVREKGVKITGETLFYLNARNIPYVCTVASSLVEVMYLGKERATLTGLGPSLLTYQKTISPE